MTNNNALVIGLLGEQFNMEVMAPQRSKESPRTPKELSVLLQVSIIEKQNNMEDRGSMDRMVELKKTIIHQLQIKDQNWGAGKLPYKITEEVMTVDTCGKE